MDAIRAQVLSVVRDYYDAFTRCDLAAAMAFWSDRDDVSCIAPLFEPAYGRDAVADLYVQVFGIIANEVFEHEVLHTAIEEPIAVVACAERSTNVVEGHTNDLLASNVLMLDHDGWRIIHRHVCWRTTREVRLNLG